MPPKLAKKAAGSTVSKVPPAGAAAKRAAVPPPGLAQSSGAASVVGRKQSGGAKRPCGPPPGSGKKPKAQKNEESEQQDKHAEDWWTGTDGKSGPCLCCKAQPGGTKPWLHIAQKGNGKSVPVGFACQPCFERNKDGWPHLGFPEYATRMDTNEGREELKEYEKRSRSKEADFLCSSVSSTMRFAYKLSRSYLCMSTAEYKQCFGKHPPGSRGPRIPIMKLPVEGSTHEEDHLVFEDPSSPWRKLTVEIAVGDNITTTSLQPDDCKYPTMASQIFSSSTKARQDRNAAAMSLFRQGTALPDIAEHMLRVNPEMHKITYGSEAGEQTATVEAQPGADNEESLEGATFVVERNAENSKLMKSFAAPTQTSPKKSPAKISAASASPAPAPPLDDDDGDRECDIGPGDPAFVVSGTDSALCDRENWASSAAFKRLPSKQKLAVLKSRLPIAAALLGKKKDREEGPVRKYITNGKLQQETEVKLLRNYMMQAYSARDLSHPRSQRPKLPMTLS